MFLSKLKINMQNSNTIKIEILPNGPAVVYGNYTLKTGETEQLIEKEKTFLCRCGASEKKPFCDGSHKKIGFQG
jgi:CDGSH-type Zn-finger protein